MISARYLLRRAAEAGLVLLLVASLAYPWTGYRAHEAAGLAWLAFALWHCALNWRWFITLTRGGYSPRRAAGLVINFLLLAATLAVGLSGLGLAYAGLEAQQAMSARLVHVAGAYWTLILCGLHAGMHLGRPFAALLRRPRAAVVTGLAAVAWGAWGFARLGLGGKLLFSTSFGGCEGALPSFTLAALGVFVACACVPGYLVAKGERK